jgi:hypothetical protein
MACCVTGVRVRLADVGVCAADVCADPRAIMTMIGTEI